MWKTGEELVVNYGPTSQTSEEISGERSPQASDEGAGGDAGIEATAGASTPELTRPKGGKKRPKWPVICHGGTSQLR